MSVYLSLKQRKILFTSALIFLIILIGQINFYDSSRDHTHKIERTSSLFAISTSGEPRLIHYQIDETGVNNSYNIFIPIYQNLYFSRFLLIYHQSSIINHQSSIINHQSSIINHQSSIINHQSKFSS
jgi:hypothetical protein